MSWVILFSHVKLQTATEISAVHEIGFELIQLLFQIWPSLFCDLKFLFLRSKSVLFAAEFLYL